MSLSSLWKNLNNSIQNYMDMYENYLGLLFPEELEMFEDWMSIFDIRTILAGLLENHPYVQVSIHTDNINKYIEIIKKLRKLDMEFLKKADLLCQVLDFSEFRKSVKTSEIKKEIPKYLWWYYFDKISKKEIKLDFSYPLWLIRKEPFKFSGVVVEGNAKEARCAVLLITPVLKGLSSQKRKFYKITMDNIRKELEFNIPAFFVRRESNYKGTTIHKKLEKYYLLLSSSGLIGELEITAGHNELKKIWSYKNFLLAIPKEHSAYETDFLDEFTSAIKEGNTKFFNQKTLRKDQFYLIPMNISVGKLEIVERLRTDEILDNLMHAEVSVPSEVSLVAG